MADTDFIYERELDNWISQVTENAESWTIESLSAKAEEMIKILSDPHDPGTRLASFAKKIVCQSKLSDYAAIALSHLIVLITAKVPDTMCYITIEFQEACKFTVPRSIAKYNKSWFKSEEDYKRYLYYKKKDGLFESDRDYLQRLGSNMKLYGALLQREVQGIDVTGYGLQEGLKWLGELLSTQANIYSTLAALKEFLSMAGFALYKKYGSQFSEKLKCIPDFVEKKKSEYPDLMQNTEYPYLMFDMTAIQSYVKEEKYLEEPQGWGLGLSLLSSDYKLVRVGEAKRKLVEEIRRRIEKAKAGTQAEGMIPLSFGVAATSKNPDSEMGQKDTALCELNLRSRILFARGYKRLPAVGALEPEQGGPLKFRKLDVTNKEDFISYKSKIDGWIFQVTESAENWTTESLSAKAEELFTILNDPCEQGVRLVAFAEKIFCQSMLSAHAATALSYLIVLVTARVPDAMMCITTEFKMTCKFAIPGSIVAFSKNSFDSEEDYKKYLKYREFESDKDYLQRLRSNMKLHGALLEREAQGIDTTGYGLPEGLMWLERMLKTSADISTTMAALKEFLNMAGFALYRQHSNSFSCLLECIPEFMEKKKSEDADFKKNPDVMSDMVAIESYIKEYKYLEKTHGWELGLALLSIPDFKLIRAGVVKEKLIQKIKACLEKK